MVWEAIATFGIKYQTSSSKPVKLHPSPKTIMIFWWLQKSNNPSKCNHGRIHSNTLRVNNHPCFLKRKIILEWKNALLPFLLLGYDTVN